MGVQSAAQCEWGVLPQNLWGYTLSLVIAHQRQGQWPNVKATNTVCLQKYEIEVPTH